MPSPGTQCLHLVVGSYAAFKLVQISCKQLLVCYTSFTKVTNNGKMINLKKMSEIILITDTDTD